MQLFLVMQVLACSVAVLQSVTGWFLCCIEVKMVTRNLFEIDLSLKKKTST